MYLGNYAGIVLIKSNVPENVHAYLNELPERTGNFSDPSQRKETMLDKFLRHMDEDLSQILKAYPLPVFVMGADRVAGHFKQITRHQKNIVGYIHGNYIGLPELEIREAVEPNLADWQQLRQTHVLGQMEVAADEKKLSSGIRDVLNAAYKKNGRLLIVEKGFVVDEAMAKVLEAGGDIEFVDDGVLKDHHRIALIRYY